MAIKPIISPPVDPDRPGVTSTSDAPVFQFMTVRTARLASDSPGNVITYQPHYNSPLVAALSGTAGQAAALRLADVADASTGDLADTLAQLTPLAEFGRWLRANQARLVIETVEQALAELAPAPASPAQLGQVWEALSQAIAAGATQANQEPLLAVLRGQHFLDYRAEAGRSAPALRALAAAEVVLPAGVLPPERALPAAPNRPSTTPATEALQTQTAQRQQLAELELALTEIRRVRDVRQEVLRNTPVPGVPADLNPETIAAFAADTDAGVASTYAEAARRADFLGYDAGLSATTVALVASLGPADALRISFLLEQLEDQASRLAQQLGQTAAVLRPVFQVGGVLWAEETPQETALQTAGATGTALDDPYQTPPIVAQPDAVLNLAKAPADFAAAEFTAADFNTGARSTADGGIGDPYDGFYKDGAAGRIRPIGIGDLNRVEQTLCCYAAGEVAHIENIMQGEYKERSTRHLLRTEDTLDVTTDSETTTERDTTSTDRFELAQEATKVLEQDSSLTLGASASGSFGPVSVQASSNFAMSSSSSQTDHQTATYAKSVTDRSLQRIVEKVRTQRTRKRTEEFEENNKHGLDNRGGAKHVVGLYRWVDKIYKAQVVNYGKRLMFEFMVPEPGNFHLWALSRAATQGSASLNLPVDPRLKGIPGQDALSSAQALTATNYQAWAAAYNASVTPPPAETVLVSLALDGSKNPIARTSTTIMSGKSDGLVVPDGYEGTKVKMIADFQDSSGGGALPGAAINVGDIGVWWVQGGNGGLQRSSWTDWLGVSPVTGKVAVSYGVVYSERFTANIVLRCTRTAAAFDAWRLKAFQAIIDAYQTQKDAYDQAVAATLAAGGDTTIRGTNPEINQQLITNELKKGCLNWLFQGQQFGTYAVWRYGDNVNPPHYGTDAQAAADGERVKFMEQCFEWELMSYTLYPYYWANQGRWRPLYQLNDPDPLLLGFLQSGMARVLVSVRPGYERAAMYFLSTGRIYNGGELAALPSPIYRSVVEEMQQPVGVRVGQPWEIRVPTTMTVLQADSGAVDGKGLPCACTPGGGLGAVPALLTPQKAATAG